MKILFLILFFSLIISSVFAFSKEDIIDSGLIPDSRMAWITVKEDTVIDKDFEDYLWVEMTSRNIVYGTMCIIIHRQTGKAFTSIGEVTYDKGFPEISWEVDSYILEMIAK